MRRPPASSRRQWNHSSAIGPRSSRKEKETLPLRYVSHYFGDPGAREAFKRFALAIFNLDFSRWEEKGLWDDRYVAFSAFEGRECISNMCAYLCDLMIEGRETQAVQLLTVGTLPAYRRRGIQRRLWSMIRNHYSPRHGVFLFTDEEAAGFYERIGFKRIREQTEIVRLGMPDRVETEFVRLDMEAPEHYRLAYRIGKQRAFVSKRLGHKTLNLLMFMLLYAYRDWTYYLPGLDCIVIAEEKADRLRLHDVIAGRFGIGLIGYLSQH